jgi:crotonobetainyl-CoA:carnitine CoA-transferase CaiB-like acyl-CoA transferase
MSVGRAPALGEDTEQILRENGYDEQTIRKLTDDGVVQCATP